MNHMDVVKYLQKKNIDILEVARRYDMLDLEKKRQFCSNLADKAFVEDMVMLSNFAIHNVLYEYLDDMVCG